MIANSAPWDNLKFDPSGVEETSRKLFATLYNTYGFFALYANVDGFDNSQPQIPLEKRPEIDRWIISLLNSLVETVESAMEDYEPTRAARAINEFVGDNLSNWYVRLNRKRFWGGEMNENKLSAYQTLYQCLETVALLLAPIAPFYADRLYADLTEMTMANNKSVHLQLLPEVDRNAIDKALEKRMALAQTITSMTLALRRKASLKVRQPLQRILVPVVDDAQRQDVESMKELILNEINVKEMQIVGGDDGVLVKRVKPDFKKLGPKFGKNMKKVAAEIQAMDQHAIAMLEKEGRVELAIEGAPAVIELADVEVISEDIPGWLVANEGNVTIALDITVTPELRMEGIARDIVNRIQNIRKNRGYEITDRIHLTFEPNTQTDGSLEAFGKYISGQVLADSLTIGEVSGEDVEHLELDDIILDVKITLDK